MAKKRRRYQIKPKLPQDCSRCGNVAVCGDPGHCPHGYGNKVTKAKAGGPHEKPIKREWEAFLQLHLRGRPGERPLSAAEAYRTIYPKAKQSSSEACAARLLAHVSVVARARELSREIASITEEFGPSIKRIVKELERIAFSDIRKAVVWRAHLVEEHDNPDGGDVLVIKHIFSNHVMLKGSDEIDEDIAAAIQSVEQTATGGLKIKFYDKSWALKLLAQYRGMLGPDDKGTSVNQQTNHYYSPVDRPPAETREEFIARRARDAKLLASPREPSRGAA